MKQMAVIVLQVLVTLFVVAMLAPLALVYLPAMREGRTGPAVIAGAAVVVFVLLRLIWPRRVV